MKVLFIHPAHPSQFTALAHYLGRVEGFQTACLTEMGNGDQVRKDNVPIAYFGYTRDGAPDQSCWYLTCYEEALRNAKGVADTLPSVFEMFPADLVIGHASFGATFYIKEMLNIPVIDYVELPGYQMAWCRKEFPVLLEHRLLHASFQSLVFSSAMKADAVITPSRHARSFFPKEIQHKVHVQMEGFDLPMLYPDKQALKHEFGLTGPIVGFAGRTLEALRGFDIFVSVARTLSTLRPDIRFLVIGSEQTLYGNELTYLNGRSFKRYVLDTLGVADDFFIFKDYLAYNDYHKHLQAMDVVLFPQFEGAANWGLFEAMASGLPVIASDRCFIPEIIESGENGFMADPYDIEGMARLCIYLLNDPDYAREIGQNARNTIKEKYSVEQCVAGYVSVIESVMAGRMKQAESG